MSKYIQIGSCAVCPNLTASEGILYCSKEKMPVPGDAIPEWCPLPNLPDKTMGYDTLIEIKEHLDRIRTGASEIAQSLTKVC